MAQEEVGGGVIKAGTSDDERDLSKLPGRQIDEAITLQRKLIERVSYGTVSQDTLDDAQQIAIRVLVELKGVRIIQLSLEAIPRCKHSECNLVNLNR